MWYTPLQAAELNSFPDWPYTPAKIQLPTESRLNNLTVTLPLLATLGGTSRVSVTCEKEFASFSNTTAATQVQSPTRVLAPASGSRVNTFNVVKQYSFIRS